MQYGSEECESKNQDLSTTRRSYSFVSEQLKKKTLPLSPFSDACMCKTNHALLKWQRLWQIFTFRWIHSGAHVEKSLREGLEGERNPDSCIVATYRPFAGKEAEQETKTHIGFAWENRALVREQRRSRMQLLCFVWFCLCVFNQHISWFIGYLRHYLILSTICPQCTINVLQKIVVKNVRKVFHSPFQPSISQWMRLWVIYPVPSSEK